MTSTLIAQGNVMEIKIRKVEDISIVQISGRLDFETASHFHKLSNLSLQGGKCVFNLQGLQFVGSCGISTFLDSVMIFIQTKSLNAKFCQVGSEFRKLFLSRSVPVVSFFDSELSAIQAFSEIEEAKPNSISEIIC